MHCIRSPLCLPTPAFNENTRCPPRGRAVLALLLAAAPASLPAQQQPAKASAPIASAAAATPAPAPAATPAGTSKPTLITTFSGGISLGAYQAGVDWALLEFYRAANRDSVFADHYDVPRYRFGTAAGASAGNINALLWAIETCTDWGGWQAPEESLFWDLWTSIDVRDLLPERVQSDADMALLNRGFINEIKKIVARRTGDERLTAACEMPIGITLTRVQSETVQLGEIPVHTQRYVVPMRARVDTVPGKGAATERTRRYRQMVFDRPKITQMHKLGVVRMPGRAGENIPLDNVFEVVKASSAFPLAFQPVVLRMRDNRDTLREEELFLDGGLFDDNPVDLALVLHGEATKGVGDLTAPTEDHQLLYVDPNNVRPGGRRARRTRWGARNRGARLRRPVRRRPWAASADPADAGLRIHERPRVRAVRPDAQDRGGGPQVAAAHHPRAPRGGQAADGVGAFLNLAFREHDFYVGAYDAIHYVLCARGENLPAPRRSPAARTTTSSPCGTAWRCRARPTTSSATWPARSSESWEVPRLEQPLNPRQQLTARVYTAVYDALREKPDTATAARERAREGMHEQHGVLRHVHRRHGRLPLHVPGPAHGPGHDGHGVPAAAGGTAGGAGARGVVAVRAVPAGHPAAGRVLPGLL